MFDRRLCPVRIYSSPHYGISQNSAPLVHYGLIVSGSHVTEDVVCCIHMFFAPQAFNVLYLGNLMRPVLECPTLIRDYPLAMRECAGDDLAYDDRV